jgi:hypothetical protein
MMQAPDILTPVVDALAPITANPIKNVTPETPARASIPSMKLKTFVNHTNPRVVNTGAVHTCPNSMYGDKFVKSTMYPALTNV